MSVNEQQEKLKKVTAIVHALITSLKPPCFLRDILRDYKQIESEELPFKRFGYETPEAFLMHSGEFTFKEIGNQLCISAKQNAKLQRSVSTTAQKSNGGKTGVRFSQRGNAPKPLNQGDEGRSHKTWNKSSYSTKVFQNLPAASTSTEVRANNSLQAQKKSNGVRSPKDNNNNCKQQDQADLREHLMMKSNQEPVNALGKSPRPILGKNNKSQAAKQATGSATHDTGNTPIDNVSVKPLEQRKVVIPQTSRQTSVQDRIQFNAKQAPPILTEPYPQPQFHKENYLKKKHENQMGKSLTYFQFNPNLDPITSLNQYCVVRRFPPPEYIVVKSAFSPLYQCRVLVNGSIYSTYPNEYLSEHQAKISCALKGIELIKQHEARLPLPQCMLSDRELLEKLYQELLTHPTGLFAKKIPELFEKKYKQTLPAKWWSLVESSNKFKYETTAGKNAIILFANTDSEDELKPTQALQMDGIKLPWTKKYWELYITHCVSTVEIWARLFGAEYNDKYDLLMADIQSYMAEKKTRPMAIVNKQIYLVATNNNWQRVRVEEVDKLNGNASCFYIDYGDTDWLAVSKLYVCDPDFLRLPAQAVPLSLFGLEDFAGNPGARRHLEEKLPSKSVIGEILTKESEFYDTESNTRGKIRVVLYDTSSAEDVNLNPILLSDISNNASGPKLNEKGLTNALVSHITDEGDLFLQILNEDIKYVQDLIQQLIESKFKKEQHRITADDLKRSNVLLICDENESGEQPAWHRGTLADTQLSIEEDFFDIYFLDTGKTKPIHISKIFRLESLSTALSKFPAQAVKVRLYNIPECNKLIVGRLRALLPHNCETMVKISAVDVIPLVTIYRHLEKAETLCTINDVIRIEHELNSLNSPGDAKNNSPGSRPVSHLDRAVNSFAGMTIQGIATSPAASHELPLLKKFDRIPPVGEFFDVRVPMSANPSNFMIQPYKEFPMLNAMMRELQEYCRNSDEFIPADMVKIGQAYAAKNGDGFYHRVTVEKIYNFEMIHVRFCDFGDIAVLRSDQLKVLPNKFRQLPKMAIQAKLHGITSRDNEWSLDDCLRFRDLTMGQKFVSTIRKIIDDDGAPLPTLEVELIDVTTDEDVLIHELLLKENRAIRTV